VAALVRGLAEGDPDLLRIGFADELHVPYRMPLIPGGAAAMDAARAAGAWAVTISGSGSGLIAVCGGGAETAVAEAMGAALVAAGEGEGGVEAEAEGEGAVLAFPVRPDFAGVWIEGR
jgi:homoserine kinase